MYGLNFEDIQTKENLSFGLVNLNYGGKTKSSISLAQQKKFNEIINRQACVK